MSTSPGLPSLKWVSLVDSISHGSSHWLLEELSLSCVTAGRRRWKLAPGFHWTLPHVPFPIADFSLYPFTVIIVWGWLYTESCESSWITEPRRWSWGSPNIIRSPVEGRIGSRTGQRRCFSFAKWKSSGDGGDVWLYLTLLKCTL